MEIKTPTDKKKVDTKIKGKAPTLWFIVAGLIAWEALTFEKQPKSITDSIVILDTQKILDNRLAEGDSAAEASMYFETLINVYKANNYLVVSSDSILGAPKELTPNVPDKDVLMRTASELGIDTSKERFKEIEQELESAAQELINRLHL